MTVHCTLSGEARLRDLWSWAKRVGVRHLDATRPEAPSATGPRRSPGRCEYRDDLLAVCEEIADDLEAQRLPIDFRPVTRIVRRLMRTEPLARFGERRFGFFPVGETPPGVAEPTPGVRGLLGALSLQPQRTAGLRRRQRRATPRPVAPCGRRRAEASLRLYHRLAQADPSRRSGCSGIPPARRTSRSGCPGVLWDSKLPC